nr:Gag-Pol polyprotein [Tanacetum cinerariifolium]
MVNSSLKKLKFHLASFDVVVKERTTVTAITEEEKIKKELEEIETINIELDHRVTKLVTENEHLKHTYKQLYDSIKSSRVRSKEQCDDLIKQVNIKSAENSVLNASLQEKALVITALKDTLSKLKGKSIVDEAITLHPIDPELLRIDVAPEIVKNERLINPLNTSLDYACNTKTDRIQQTQSRAKKNKLEAYLRNVRTNLHNKKSVVNTKAIASVPNSKLNVNSDLKCATCNGCLFSDNYDSCVLEFINSVNARVKSKSAKKPVNIKIWKPTGKVFTTIEYKWRPTGRIFTIVGNVSPLTRITTTAIVPLRKPIPLESNTSKPVASKTKSWLWHRRLSHMNFGAINHLARQGLVRGLPKLKFEKDHLCSACVMGKSKKKSHKPKSEDTNQEKLSSAHGYLWTNTSKDEAPYFIIKFLKMIQVQLKVPVRRIRTDNGTNFVNQTLHEYYEQVGISHETSVACSPQQNGVVERRCGYRMLHLKSIHWKLQPKADIGIFIGYAPTKKAFWIYNKRTRRVVETIHVDFDELTAMAYEQSSSGPALHEMNPATISSGLVPKPTSSTTFVPPSRNDWDLLFQPLFDELLTLPPSVDPPAPEVIAPIADVIPPEQAESTASPSSTIVDQDAPSPSKSQTTPETQSPIEAMQEEINEFERLEVWELVTRPDKVMVITLKWIYKVKLDELGGILKNKARLVARGYRQEEGIDFE